MEFTKRYYSYVYIFIIILCICHVNCETDDYDFSNIDHFLQKKYGLSLAAIEESEKMLVVLPFGLAYYNLTMELESQIENSFVEDKVKTFHKHMAECIEEVEDIMETFPGLREKLIRRELLPTNGLDNLFSAWKKNRESQEKLAILRDEITQELADNLTRVLEGIKTTEKLYKEFVSRLEKLNLTNLPSNDSAIPQDSTLLRAKGAILYKYGTLFLAHTQEKYEKLEKLAQLGYFNEDKSESSGTTSVQPVEKKEKNPEASAVAVRLFEIITNIAETIRDAQDLLGLEAMASFSFELRRYINEKKFVHLSQKISTSTNEMLTGYEEISENVNQVRAELDALLLLSERVKEWESRDEL